MKIFDYTISNPPYQEVVGDKTDYGVVKFNNVFHKFQLFGQDHSHNTIMIYPGGRWLRFKGRGLKSFGYNLINDPRLYSVYFIPGKNSKTVFNTVMISDGLSIVNWRDNFNADFLYFNNNKIKSPGDNYIPLIESDIVNIIKKVMVNFTPLSDRGFTYRTVKFNSVPASKQLSFLVEDYSDPPSVLKDPIKAYINNTFGVGSRNKIYWIENSIYKDNNVVDKYKVCIRANLQGRETINQYKFILVDKDVIVSRTKMTLGVFNTYEEAYNFRNYMDCKIIKIFLKAASGTRDSVGHKLTCFVPDLGDYSDNNEFIDWSKPLDNQLYSLFGLTPEEVKIIEEY